MLEATFYGVRGSTPCSCAATAEIGGNTSAVLIQIPDCRPILLDIGTGARYAGKDLVAAGLGADVVVLVTHLHWDHVQGLPFFAPVLNSESRIDLVGPSQDDMTLRAALDTFVRPPLFPVDRSILPASIQVTETSFARFEVDRAMVTVRPVPHCGATNGYRIDAPECASIAYLPDHQQPTDGSMRPTEDVIALCADVDVLVHDCQYSAEHFADRPDWGHSTPEFAVAVARHCGARRLVLTHHDPTSDTAAIQRLANEAAGYAGSEIEVVAAHEGLRVRSGVGAAVAR